MIKEITFDDKKSPDLSPILNYMGENGHGVYRVEITLKTLFNRYSYYFGYFIPKIINHFKISVALPDGTARLATAEELHYFHKLKFNSAKILDTETGEWVEIAAKTTGMSDRQFIERFEEEIYIYYSQLFCENFPEDFMTREEWRAEMERKRNQKGGKQ